MRLLSWFRKACVGALLPLGLGCGSDQLTEQPTVLGSQSILPPSLDPRHALVAASENGDPHDGDVQNLASTSQPVRWYYFLEQESQHWYIVAPSNGAVLMLDRVDQATTFGVYWKPIHNYQSSQSEGTQSYPNAGNNLTSVTMSLDGRTVSFGTATVSANSDADVSVLANTSQQVLWFYIANQNVAPWYIVSPTSRAVLRLQEVDRNKSFGILWKPVNDFVARSSAATTGFPDAGDNFTTLVVASDGKSVAFGPAAVSSTTCLVPIVDAMYQEYRDPAYAYPADLMPTCSDFTSSGGNADFSWRALNGGFEEGNPHDPWGMVKPSLLEGLEATLAEYSLVRQYPGIMLTSGYRTPRGNVDAGGEPLSLHTYGRAADMYSRSYGGTGWLVSECEVLRNAASNTNPAELLSCTRYDNRHLHAAW